MLTLDKNNVKYVKWPYLGFLSKCTMAASVLNTVAFMSYKAKNVRYNGGTWTCCNHKHQTAIVNSHRNATEQVEFKIPLHFLESLSRQPLELVVVLTTKLQTNKKIHQKKTQKDNHKTNKLAETTKSQN